MRIQQFAALKFTVYQNCQILFICRPPISVGTRNGAFAKIVQVFIGLCDNFCTSLLFDVQLFYEFLPHDAMHSAIMTSAR